MMYNSHYIYNILYKYTHTYIHHILYVPDNKIDEHKILMLPQFFGVQNPMVELLHRCRHLNAGWDLMVMIAVRHAGVAEVEGICCNFGRSMKATFIPRGEIDLGPDLTLFVSISPAGRVLDLAFYSSSGSSQMICSEI